MSSAAPTPSEIAHVQPRIAPLPVGGSSIGGPSIDRPRIESPQHASRSFAAICRALARDVMVFFKLRVTALIVITAWAGYYLGTVEAHAGSFGPTLWNTLGGVALVSGGAGALNQVFERDTDALMRRTAKRPMAAGRLGFGPGLLIGISAIVLGSLWLMIFTEPITGILTFLTAITYTCVYTPLKRHTTLATFIGAFPGAMPPLIGWTAARGAVEWPAIALFAILFIWQFPHFMAIAWLYREDYGRAGIRMLPVVEPDGRSTVMEALTYAVLMIPVSLVPYYLHMAGNIYWVAALVLGLGYLAYTIRFARITRCAPNESRRHAKALLKASVIYLPILLAVLMWNAGGR